MNWLRAFFLFLVFAVISLSITVLTVGALRWRAQNETLEVRTGSANIFGQRGFYSTFTVISYDATSDTLVALMRSNAAGQDLAIRVQLHNGTTFEKRDAVLVNGVIVGAGENKPSDRSALKIGAKGVARVTVDPKGVWVSDYILTGDPFPRP